MRRPVLAGGRLQTGRIDPELIADLLDADPRTLLHKPNRGPGDDSPADAWPPWAADLSDVKYGGTTHLLVAAVERVDKAQLEAGLPAAERLIESAKAPADQACGAPLLSRAGGKRACRSSRLRTCAPGRDARVRGIVERTLASLV
jgi:hypothetical protein